MPVNILLLELTSQVLLWSLMREWEWHKGHTELGSQCLKLHKEVCVSDLAIQCDLATNHHQQKAEGFTVGHKIVKPILGKAPLP